MKKLISTLALIAIMVVLTTTIVSAATAKTLVDDLYALATKYGITTVSKVEMERYLADHPVTDAQAEAIYSKAQDMAKIMDDAKVTDYRKLTKEQKDQIRSLANEAASIAGLTLTFKDGFVTPYSNGKPVTSISLNGKLAYTGNSVNSILVVSSIAVLALATGIVAKRKFANA